MVHAEVKWKQQFEFEGHADSGHPVIVDGDSKAGSSPMELVLIALCGCTGYDVVSILQKKREPVTAVEVTAEAERAPQSPHVFTWIKLRYRIAGKVSRKAAGDAVRLSEEKYCSVAAMLNKTAKIIYDIQLDA